MATNQEDIAGKQFSSPEPGTGAIYVYRTRAGNNSTLTVGQRTLGMLNGGHWLRADLSAGEHDLRCTVPTLSDAVRSVMVQLRPGETRYFLATERLSTMSCHLDEQSPEIARPAILQGHRVRELR